MQRRTFVAGVAVTAGTLAARTFAVAQTGPGTPTDDTGGTDMANTAPETGYAPVNGLQMYYELHGRGGVPLLLLHGSYYSIGLWGAMLPALAESRRVIAPEQQAHGHTADIDRPLTFEQMADDTAALLDHLAVDQADLLGYSLGGQIALQLAIRHPARVRKLVVAAAPYRHDGWFPEVVAISSSITPELFAGSPVETEYQRVAPDPAGFPELVAKLNRLHAEPYAWPDDAIRAIPAPTLILLGDADGVRPEHAVDLFRLRGGGIPGDLGGLPSARLAVLPGTTHVGLIGERSAWLVPMVAEFLDAPMPEATPEAE